MLGLRRLGSTTCRSALRLGVHDHFQEASGRRVTLDAIVSLKVASTKRIRLVNYCEPLAIFNWWARLSEHVGLIYARNALVLVTLALDKLLQS